VSLQTVLAGIEPAWFAGADGATPDPALLARARDSRLGERILARWLAAGPAAALLAPTAQREVGGAALRWPRTRLGPLLRDLGVLSMAPAIRAEVGRDPVRCLKHALGSSYLLALDRSVWDGRVPAASAAALAEALRAALTTDRGLDTPGHDALYALLDHHGRSELRTWAREHDPALGEWVALLHPRENALPSMLPDPQVRLLHEHHLARERRV
jgi:hypothetical protein